MSNSESKEYIINKIRTARESDPDYALQNSVNENISPEKIYNTENEIPEIIFARQLLAMNGKFIFAENLAELKEGLYSLFQEKKWKSIFCIDNDLINIFKDTKIKFSNSEKDFLNMDAGITTCEHLVARFGSVVISSKQASGRRLNIYPPVHIVIANSSQLVMEPGEALQKIKNKYSNNLPSLISMITGPSRTADIEKTLVMGAHGPKELIVFLLNDK
ncbi:lactate utilization protein C [Bacteroidota bacterium]